MFSLSGLPGQNRARRSFFVSKYPSDPSWPGKVSQNVAVSGESLPQAPCFPGADFLTLKNPPLLQKRVFLSPGPPLLSSGCLGVSTPRDPGCFTSSIRFVSNGLKLLPCSSLSWCYNYYTCPGAKPHMSGCDTAHARVRNRTCPGEKPHMPG